MARQGRHRIAVLFIALGLQVPAAAKTHSHVGATAEASRELPQPPRMLAGLSQDRIIAIVEKRHNAKVVKAEKDDLKGRRIYVLRLLSKEGRVWTVKVDAETGGEL